MGHNRYCSLAITCICFHDIKSNPFRIRNAFWIFFLSFQSDFFFSVLVSLLVAVVVVDDDDVIVVSSSLPVL